MAVLIAVAIVVVVALERDAGITHLNMFAVGRWRLSDTIHCSSSSSSGVGDDGDDDGDC